MLIFVAIALGSFILIAGSFFFGHDHDASDAGHDHGGGGHDVSHDAEPTIGLFSLKVLGTLTMGFGAAGAIARNYDASYLVASLWGTGTGIMLAGMMYFVLKLVYSQQISSLVTTSSAIGQQGTVSISIGEMTAGEIELFVGGQQMVYLARSAHGKPIAKGRIVNVVRVAGSELFVEEVA
ncbi:MAG: NfeD family protein [bacterium]